MSLSYFKMLKKKLAYTLVGISFIGIIFFEQYKGNLDKSLSLIVCILTFLIASYVAYTARTKKEIVSPVTDSNRRNKLIETGEQIKLDIDSCDIKENNYYEDVTWQGPSEIESIDAIFDPNENFREKFVDQSAIIYHHKIGDETEKYISQSFELGKEAITFHILNNDIILYVDRFDRSNYLFELNEKPGQLA
jgi:hypothetical protein